MSRRDGQRATLGMTIPTATTGMHPHQHSTSEARLDRTPGTLISSQPPTRRPQKRKGSWKVTHAGDCQHAALDTARPTATTGMHSHQHSARFAAKPNTVGDQHLRATAQSNPHQNTIPTFAAYMGDKAMTRLARRSAQRNTQRDVTRMMLSRMHGNGDGTARSDTCRRGVKPSNSTRSDTIHYLTHIYASTAPSADV